MIYLTIGAFIAWLSLPVVLIVALTQPIWESNHSYKKLTFAERANEVFSKSDDFMDVVGWLFGVCSVVLIGIPLYLLFVHTGWPFAILFGFSYYIFIKNKKQNKHEN